MRKVYLRDVAVVALMIGLSARIAAAASDTAAGVVTAVSGTVTVTRASASSQALKFRDALFWQDIVEARKDGIARVLLGGKTTVTVRELSRLELREEQLVEGVRYTVELVRGKVRASVARMLMRPGEQVEVRTRNAVASVRGTDFIVETVERPGQTAAFGLLGVLQVAQGVAERGGRTGETVVVALSGVVEVSNRLSGAGPVERIGAYQAVRVSGMHKPLRFDFTPDMLPQTLSGLTPARREPLRSVNTAASTSASTSPRSDHGTLSDGRGTGLKASDRSGGRDQKASGHDRPHRSRPQR